MDSQKESNNWSQIEKDIDTLKRVEYELRGDEKDAYQKNNDNSSMIMHDSVSRESGDPGESFGDQYIPETLTENSDDKDDTRVIDSDTTDALVITDVGGDTPYNPYAETFNHAQYVKNLQTASIQKFGTILNQYLMNPTDALDLNGIKCLETIPDAIKDFKSIKILKVSNCDLSNLRNIPVKLERLICRANQIKEIEDNDIPETLVHIDATNNCIESISLTNRSIHTLILSGNSLTQKLNFPETLTCLNVSNSNIDKVGIFETLVCLTELNISRTRIESIDNLPDSIKILKMNKVKVPIILSFPQDLEQLHAISSGIEQMAFESFSQSLMTIDLYNNELSVIPILPDIVDKIDLTRNRLIEIPKLPKTINIEFDIRYNPVTSKNINIIEQISQDLKTANPAANIMFSESDECTQIDDNDFFDTYIAAEQRRAESRSRQDRSMFELSQHASNAYDPRYFDAFKSQYAGSDMSPHDTSPHDTLSRNEMMKIGGGDTLSRDDLIKISTRDGNTASTQNIFSGSRSPTGNTGMYQNSGPVTLNFGRGRGNGMGNPIGNGIGNPTGNGMGGKFTNLFKPAHDKTLVRKMTDDGHRCNKKYRIKHESIYNVN
jgi:hypothetical protein